MHRLAAAVSYVSTHIYFPGAVTHSGSSAAQLCLQSLTTHLLQVASLHGALATQLHLQAHIQPPSQLSAYLWASPDTVPSPRPAFRHWAEPEHAAAGQHAAALLPNVAGPSSEAFVHRQGVQLESLSAELRPILCSPQQGLPSINLTFTACHHHPTWHSWSLYASHPVDQRL